MGPILVKILIGEYLVIAVAYGAVGDWPRVGYFISAALISVSVLFIK